MKLSRIILILALFFTNTISSNATHFFGAEITYEFDRVIYGSPQYKIKAVFYRNCNGAAFTTPTGKAYCNSSSSSTSITFNYVSIKNVTPVCPSAQATCQKPNQYNANFGIERIEYRGTVRLFPNCNSYTVAVSQCCRPDTISTGPKSTNGFVYCTIYPNEISNGPKFNSEPITHFMVNQPAFYSFTATDSDGDSISYDLALPEIGKHTTTGYDSGFSLSRPLTVYDTSSSGIVNPYSSPPNGFYIDKVLGQMIFTPTKGGEVTVFAIQAIEWRKDSSGIYRKIGVSRREVPIIIDTSSRNYPPEILGAGTYTIMEGQTLKFQLDSKDSSFVSSGGAFASDTVKLDWSGLPSGSTMKLLNPNDTNPSLQFEWKPTIRNCPNIKYHFNVGATDNACPINARTSRTITINVLKNQSSLARITDLKTCGNFKTELRDTANIDSIRWDVLDTGLNLVDTTKVLVFSSSDSAYSAATVDTLTIRQNGTYYLRSSIFFREGCTAIDTFLDTIVFERKNLKLISYSDTSLCEPWTLMVHPDQSDTSLFSKFNWNSGLFKDSSVAHNIWYDSMKVKEIILEATTPNGCIYRDSVEIHTGYAPKWNEVSPDTMCDVDSNTLDVSKYINTGNYKTGFTWYDSSTNPQKTFKKQGLYTCIATNRCGSDTLNFIQRVDTVPIISTIANDTICDGDSILKSFSDLSRPKWFPRTFTWSDSYSGSDRTLTDSGFYKVYVFNKCGADSTYFRLNVDKIPRADLGRNDTLCLSDTLDIQVRDKNDIGLYSRNFEWENGLRSANRSFVHSGNYRLLTSNICGTDTADLTVHDNDIPEAVNFENDTLCGSLYSTVTARVKNKADLANLWFEWTDGIKDSTRRLSASGLYRYAAINECGADTGSIRILRDSLPDLVPLFDTTICAQDSVSVQIRDMNFSIPAFRKYAWSDGYSGNHRTLYNVGKYKLKVSNKCGSDTGSINIQPGEAPGIKMIAQDTMCQNDSIYIMVSDTNKYLSGTYKWNDGVNRLSRYFSSPGLFSIFATNACGVDSSEIVIIRKPIPELITLADDTICGSAKSFASIRVKNPQQLGIHTLVWSDGYPDSNRMLTKYGKYGYVAFNECGADTGYLNIYRDSIPVLVDIADTSICKGDTIQVTVRDTGYSIPEFREYNWSDGYNGMDRVISDSGIYKAVVENACGSDSVEFKITQLTTAIVDLGPDTSFLIPFKYILSTDSTHGSIIWNTGDTSWSVTADSVGFYWAKVTNVCGTNSDTVLISDATGIIASRLAHLNVMPNPSNGNFEILSEISPDHELRIFDATGKDIPFSKKISKGRMSVSLEDAKPGIYQIYVVSDGKVYSGRIVVH